MVYLSHTHYIIYNLLSHRSGNTIFIINITVPKVVATYAEAGVWEGAD